MAKILLVNSSSPEIMGKKKDVGGKHHPLGLLYIASVLLNNNHEVQICDELVGQNPELFIKAFAPQFVGISVRTPAFTRAIEIADIAKKNGATIILGGPHVSALPEESLRASESVDGVIVGEGEYALLDLINATDWSVVSGLVYRKNNQIVSNKVTQFINNLDSIPFPARNLLEEKSYYGIPEYGFIVPNGQNFWTICSSRGCPYLCTYCSSSNIFGRKFRFRSAKNIFDEILLGYNQGVKNFVFVDDSFGLNKEISTELCNLIIDNNLKIKWCCQTRVTIPIETMVLMKKSGCILISFGVESGSEKVLKNIKKGTTLNLIKKGIENAKKAGLLVKAYFIIGLPGEGSEEFKESLSFARSIDIDYLWLSSLRVMPGSELWTQNTNSFDYENMHWIDFAYFGKNKDRVIHKRYNKFLISFFLNPRYIKNFIKRITYGELKYLLMLFFIYIRERIALKNQ